MASVSGDACEREEGREAKEGVREAQGGKESGGGCVWKMDAKAREKKETSETVDISRRADARGTKYADINTHIKEVTCAHQKRKAIFSAQAPKPSPPHTHNPTLPPVPDKNADLPMKFQLPRPRRLVKKNIKKSDPPASTK